MKIVDILDQELNRQLYREDNELVSNVDGVGVELELENIEFFKGGSQCITPYLKSLPLPSGFWKWVEDGSLREGTEFIFRGPLVGANISAALDEMTTFLEIYRMDDEPVRITDRCSVHVHLDVRDFCKEELNNLILMYLVVERVLFQHINPLRLKNNYCRPLSDSSFKYILHEMLNKSSYSGLPSLCQIVNRECDKYSALNVLPITKFGSIEFRHHHGTADLAKVKEWINVILALKVASRNFDIHDIISIWNNQGYTGIMSSVFKGTILEHKDEGSMPEIKTLLSKGIYDVKEVLDMGKLRSINKSRSRRKVKDENSLLHHYKEANNLSSVLSEFNAVTPPSFNISQF